MLDLFDELSSLIRGLDAQGVPYALCGGLAMAVWGRPRATIDIDLVIPAESLDTAKAVARSSGYLLDAAPMSFAAGAVEIRRLTKVDPDQHDVLSVDFLLVTPELQEVWDGRVHVQWEAGELWVVSRAGMIKLKSLRGSGQDKDDIEALSDADG